MQLLQRTMGDPRAPQGSTAGWRWGGEEREHPFLWVVPLEELKKGVQVQETSWSKDFYAQAPQIGLLHFLALLVSVSAPQAALGGILLFKGTFDWCRGRKKSGREKLQRFEKFPFWNERFC